MAGEIQVIGSLRANTGKLEYQSGPTSYTANLSTAVGPLPGAFKVTPVGVNVNLDALDIPGMFFLQNLDEENKVEVGIWDSQTLTFYPLFKVRPGKFIIGEFSENLRQEYGTGPGTGTIDFSMANHLRIRSYNQDCWVRLDAFEGVADL